MRRRMSAQKSSKRMSIEEQYENMFERGTTLKNLQVDAKGARAKAAKHMKEVFNMFDEDASASVDTEEFIQLMHTLGITESTDDELIALFESFDEDNSGTIDAMEFLAFLGQQEDAITSAFQLFDPMDTGVVSVAEFFQMFQQHTDKPNSTKEIEEMLDKAGVDEKGFINYRDFAHKICYHDGTD